MKILFDYSAFSMQSRGGVSRVLYELFVHLIQFDDMDCRLFAGFHCNLYLREAPDHVKKRMIGWYVPKCLVKQRIMLPLNGFLFRLYTLFFFRPDICHFTYFATPAVPSGCKVVVTIHDLIHELFYGDRKLLKYFDKKHAIDRADGIVCISANTLGDLRKFYGVDDKRLEVIYHGNSLVDIVPELPHKPAPFFLYVGNRSETYKNFDIVMEAFAAFADGEVDLVCFGGGAFSAAELKKIEDLKLNGRICQLGGSDAVLAGYYADAMALVYPSKYEGFGLPPIEAMGLGCPVISSSAAPMPEVVGDAGLFFPPDDVEGLAECMRKVRLPEERKVLIERGAKRAKDFTWQKSARQAARFYADLMDGC